MSAALELFRKNQSITKQQSETNPSDAPNITVIHEGFETKTQIPGGKETTMVQMTLPKPQVSKNNKNLPY